MIKWTSDYSKTPESLRPPVTEQEKKEDHVRKLQQLTGNNPYWVPDKTTERAYKAGEVGGVILQAVGVGKVLRVVGVGGQLANWVDKARFYYMTGAISGAIDAYGEGKDLEGITSEAAFSGALAVPFGFAGEYIGNQIAGLAKKVAPKVKNFVSDLFRSESTGFKEPTGSLGAMRNPILARYGAPGQRDALLNMI